MCIDILGSRKCILKEIDWRNGTQTDRTADSAEQIENLFIISISSLGITIVFPFPAESKTII